jgi:hypothetical protein
MTIQYSVISIPFLKPGAFTERKALDAFEWCKVNCENRFRGSDLHPWAFLSEKDAVAFSEKFGGTVRCVRTEGIE